MNKKEAIETLATYEDVSYEQAERFVNAHMYAIGTDLRIINLQNFAPLAQSRKNKHPASPYAKFDKYHKKKKK